MTARLIPYYQKLPAPFRHAVATARGYILRWQRYPPNADALAEEILARDDWSAAQWKHYTEERLAFMLHRAATRVPFYRQQWESRRRQGDRASWEYLENWPLLTKEVIRTNGMAMIADDLDPKSLLMDRTGGSTGAPLKIWLNRAVNQQLYALVEARMRRWNGVSRYQRWGTMGGQQIISIDATKPPYWVHNLALRQIYLSTNHISTLTAPDYIRALTRHRTTHLIAYTSSIAYLARQAVQLQLPPPPDLRVVLTNAEGLFPWQREIIQQGLGCVSRQTYGMVEIVATASEKDNQLYLWPEMGHVEVMHDDRDELVSEGHAGRFICTGLLNPVMPLIRYDIGDRGIIASADPQATRMAYPRIVQLEGRVTDMLIAHDGRQVWYFNPLFSGLPIHEAQVIQETLALVRIFYVPAEGYSDVTAETIRQRLHARLGKVELKMEQVERVPREPNGKFRLVVCRVSPEERRLAGER